MSCFHGKQTPLNNDGVHTPISYIYINSAARLSASGFTAEDGYKLALDLDTNSIFILINWSTPTWQSFGGGPGSDTSAIHININGEIAGATSTIPTSSDLLLIEDVDNSNNKKKITLGDLNFNNIGGGTLAQLNSLISDASVDASGSSRPPNGTAGGDLTGTYPNPTINNNSITFAKFQNVNTDILLGRDSSGSGIITEISLASTLVFTGSNSIGRAEITGDISISAGSNNANITAGAIVNADINSSAAIAVSKLAAGTNGQVLTISGGTPTWTTPSGGSSNTRLMFGALDFLSPVNSNWAINGLAPAASDTVNASLSVRRFDDTTEEGVGFGFTIPSGTTNLTFYIKSRAQSTPGGSVAVVPSLWRKTVGDNTAVGSWSSRLNMTSLNFTTNTNFQYDSQTISLTTLGLTADNYVLFELTRNTGSGSDTLSGDWSLLELVVVCS